MQKTIVCFGDSNTWGANPAEPRRFAPDVRWTGVLQGLIGDGFKVIEEGLNGRTTNIEDPVQPHRNGLTYLHPCLESHAPFDLVAIMLGTNDLKARINRSSSDIAEAAAGLAGRAVTLPFGPDGAPPKVLLIAPPPVGTISTYAEMFAGAKEKSKHFGALYRVFAGWHPISFLDAGKFIQTSEVDGIHFDAEAHQKLGEAIAQEVRRLLS